MRKLLWTALLIVTSCTPPMAPADSLTTQQTCARAAKAFGYAVFAAPSDPYPDMAGIAGNNPTPVLYAYSAVTAALAKLAQTKHTEVIDNPRQIMVLFYDECVEQPTSRKTPLTTY